MKIAYCLNSINYTGGTETVTIAKANAFAEDESNEVFIFVTDENGKYPKKLNPKVKIIDLKINYYKNDWKKGVRAKFFTLFKKLNHRKKLRIELEKIKPDVVISVGQSEKYFLTKNFLKKSKPIYIREIHFATNYRSLLAKSKKDKLLAKIMNFIDFKLFSNLYDVVVCLTPEDKRDNWAKKSNVYCVPNPLTIDFESKENKTEFKKIISVGRLSYQKNYNSLINSFSLIADKYPDWCLEIYGDGEEKNVLEKLIIAKGLTRQVKLMGKTSNVSEVLSKADFFVLTSRMEGFGVVLLEAMVHGLPVISYDLPYGPSFIINDNNNGFLIKHNDEIELAEKMEKLINDLVLRNQMSEAAVERAKQFFPNKIAEQWINIFQSLKNS